MQGMKREPTTINFGKRLATLRKAAGLTQQQLGDQIGVSRRVIAYYEGETNYPPAHLILPLAEALKVSTDELLDANKTKQLLDPKFASLWRKLKVLEALPDRDRKAVMHYVEALAEKNKTHSKTAHS